MHDYFDLLVEDEKPIFSAIADLACSLGYKARKDKVKSPSYTFVHRKVKSQILRFSTDKRRAILKIKFFASQNYSKFFQEAIRTVIEEYDYKYTGCYGCGSCDGTQGYHYAYPDGREYYRCGKELIDVTEIRQVPLSELLGLLQTQHQYAVARAQKASDAVHE